jgi:uncharacterized protein YjiS (DUF1127 family)
MNSSIYGKVAVVSVRQTRHGTPLPGRLQAAVSGLFDRLLLWHARAQSRRMLRTLDDHMLGDIGIDRTTAEREGSVPFWR